MKKQAEQRYGKNRTWQAILYPENMLPDWKDRIDDIVQLPFAYCVHDKGLELEDLQEERKVHIHLILVWPNTTTFKSAMTVFGYLSATGKNCVGRVEPVIWHERAYKYLIHDTDKAREQGKYQFDPAERITGNNYDIGAYIQVSTLERNEMFDDLTDFVLDNGISNFADFIQLSREAFKERKEVAREVIRGHNGYFEKLVKGCYHRQRERIDQDPDEVEAKKHEWRSSIPYKDSLESLGMTEADFIDDGAPLPDLCSGEWGPDLLDDDTGPDAAEDVWGAQE